MATAVEQAKHEQALAPSAPVTAKANTVLYPANQNHVNDNTAPGIDPMDFVRDNRIHIKNGSLFIDPYLVIHPRELDPANEDRLRKKLQLTYSINNPSFYESPERVAIALNLGQLVPVSLQAKRSKLMEEVKSFNAQVDTGTDADLQQQAHDKREPFTAIVRDTVDNGQADPVGMEVLKNGLAIYLLCREKLTQQGYLNNLSGYVLRNGTPDQVLADLADKIGVTPREVREAALTGGVDGVGKLLGLDPKYTADVKALAEYASQHDFGYNLVEHWHLGRQLLGIDAPMQQKLTTGMDARITAKIGEYRNRMRHHYEVPTPIVEQEQRVAQALELVEPVQRALLHRLGYEICYSPEITADDIAFHKGVYGLHRKAANNLRDVEGTYRIYFSGKGDLKGSMRTLCHEIAHNMWPEQFTTAQTHDIDQLAASDQQRFALLQRLMDEQFPAFDRLAKAYHAGNAQEKAAVIAAANGQFSTYGITVDQLFPYMRDANEFRFMVKHAADTLSIEGERYNRSGYDGPQERFREVLSRFAELKQVEHRAEPELLTFLAPGLTKIWDQYYIPHLKKVYASITSGRAMPHHLADAIPQEEPKIEEQPKVQEIPKSGTPVKVPIAACAVDAAPFTTVDATSALRMNDLTLAANNALNDLGIAGR